ncbi:FGGY family carbohydrate kinase, partial [Extibacter sp. GGCC_0201]
PDYLVYRLTGHFGTDYCEASTSCLYQIREKRWSPEMRAMIGLEKEYYPEIRGSVLAAGTLSPDMAERFLLPQEIDV